MEKEVIRNPVEATVAYALSRDKGAPASRLMKLIFLAEIEHLERFGKPLCGAGFINYKYGPWSADIDKAVSALQGRSLVNENRYTTKNARICHARILVKNKDLWWVPPTPRAQEILDSIIAQWKGRPLEDLVQAAKAKPQYVGTRFCDAVAMNSHLPVPFSRPEDIDEDALLPDLD